MADTIVHLPTVGQRVKYRTRTATRGWLEDVEREGVVTIIWGNGWDGAHIDTTTGGFIPSLGDTWEVIDG